MEGADGGGAIDLPGAHFHGIRLDTGDDLPPGRERPEKVIVHNRQSLDTRHYSTDAAGAP